MDDDDNDNDDASPADDDDDNDDDASPAATWTDASTHLMWEVGKSGGRDWDSALTYCTGLSLAGYGDWRLPTINEMRTIVAGCAATETGGLCGVTNACAAPSGRNENCSGCAQYAGPGPAGCYWPSEWNDPRKT